MSQFDIDMANAEKEYNKLMDMPTITGNSVIDDILNTDSTSSIIKKLVNTTYSAETKEAVLKQKTLEKTLDMDGYKRVKAIFIDGDSGYWEDETGRHEFRLSDFNYIDTVDKLKAINNSMYKSIHQPTYVSRITGKPTNLLTEEDYANVSNYQARQVHNSFADPSYQIEKYDSNIKYDALEKIPVEIAVKNIGTDMYGRSLVEAINPTTGRQVSFDMSNNPFLNVNFDLYKSLDTSSNRNKLENYLQSQKLKEIYKEKAKDAFDYDNRLLENIDIIQSNALQSASRVLKRLPSFLVDKKYWESLADPETGQILADAITGVKPSTRKTYTKAMNSALDNIKQGNYIDGILGVVTQFDRLLADSAVQIGLMFAGGGLGKVASASLGLSGKTATTISVLSAGMLASADQTLANIEEYKKNNGIDMPAKDVAINFLGNIALTIPDYLLAKSGITKLFSGKFKSNSIKEAVTDIGKSTISEGLQEMTQDTFNEYMTQDQSNPNSIIDIFTSPEQQLSGIAGGVMGGGLSIVPNTVAGIRGTRAENKNNNIRNQIIENNQTITPINTESDKTISDNVKNYVSTIDSSTFKSDEDFISTVKILEGLVGSDSKLDKDTIELVQKKSKDLIKEKLLSETDNINRENFLKALGKTKEEIFEEEVYFSDLNAEKQFIRTGKQLTDKAKEQVKKELLDFASKIGVSKEFATKTMSEVATQVKYGWNGYKTYEAALRNINERLSDTNLSEEERTRLQNDKDGWTYQLVRLLNSQANKLVKFADAADKIASGNARNVKFDYDKKTSSFTLYGSHLANHTYESGYTAYGIVQDIYNTTTNIKNILKENLSDKELQTFLNKYSSPIDFNKDDIALNTFKNASTNIRKGIKTSVKAKLDKQNISFSDRELIAKLDRLSKGMTNSSREVEFINNIRNASSEQLESIRNYINNSNIKNKTKLLSKLDEIINLDKTTEQEFNKIQKEAKVVLDESNKIETKYTDEYISSLDSTNINSASREIRDITTKLAITTTKESKEVLERIKKIKNKVDDRNKELKKKQFEEAKKIINKNGSIIIDNETIDYTVVSRKELNAPAKTTSNGIKISNDINRNDLKLQKEIKDKLQELGINYDSIIASLKDSDIQNFIIYHEYRHFKQIEKTDSLKAFTNKYNAFKENRIIYKTDAMLYALYKSNLITRDIFRNALKTIRKDIINTNNTETNNSTNNISISTKDSPIQIYSDGSHIKGTEKIGYGAIFVYQNKQYGLSGTEQSDSVKELKEKFPSAKFSNPTMELLALSSILETFANTGKNEHIVINQDYVGAVNYSKLWDHSVGSNQRANKPWKAKEPYIDYLVKKTEKAIETIEANGGSVTIKWVKGHQTTNTNEAKMNDLADTYAKSRDIFNNVLDVYNTLEPTNSSQETKVIKSNIEETIDSTKKNPSIITPTSLKETTVYKAIDKFIETQGKDSSNNGIIAYRANTDIIKKANKKGIVIIGNPFNWTDKKYGSNRKEAEKIVTNLFERWIKGDLNNEVGYSADNIIKDVFLNRYSNIFYYTDNAPINHATVLQDLQTFLRDNVKSNEWNDNIITLVHDRFTSRFNSTSKSIDSIQKTNINNNENESNIENMTNVSDTEKQIKKDNSTVIKFDIEETINNNESIVSDTTTEVVISNSIVDTDIETEIASVEESKVMATNTLLDSKTNVSATLAPYGFTFNLADELSITKNPQSILAINGITEDTKEILKPIKNIANRIKFKLNGLSNVKFPAALFLSSGGTIENVKKSILYNAPHLRLLYKITPTKFNDKKSFNFEFNELILVAVDLAAKEFLSSSNLDKLTNPKTKYDIASIFGLNEETISNDLYQELRRFVKEHGIPRTVLAERIGSLVIKNLSLTRNKETGTKGFYEKVISGLGLFALDYITELGYLTKDTFNAEEYSKKIKQEYNVDVKHPLTNNGTITAINTVKRTKKSLEPILNNFLGKKVKVDGKIVRQGGLKDKYKIEDNSVRGPRITKNKLPRHMKVRNTNGMSDIPAFEKKTLNKLWNTPYTINLDLVRFILNNLKDVKDRLGIVPESTMEQLAKDTAISSEGVNLSIESQLNYLFKYAAYQQRYNNDWYFNWFMSRNGRLFIDSNTINPQTSKIQRFLMLPNDLYRDFDPNSEFNKKMESFAIAQAFDSLGTNEDIEALDKAMNNLSIEQLYIMIKDLVKLDEKEFSKKYSNLYINHKGKEAGLDGIENFGQCLVILQHLINKKKANGKSFKTWLAVEIDSTTSGYFIRFMAFPDPEILDKFGEKVGIININSATPKTEIYELKKTEGFNDIYQTMALGTAEELPIISNEEEKEKRILKLREKIKKIEENKTINYEHPIWSRRTKTGAVKVNKKRDTINNMSSDALESFITYINNNISESPGGFSLYIDRQINKNKKTILLTLTPKTVEQNDLDYYAVVTIKFTTSKNDVIVDISVINSKTNEDITNKKGTFNYLNQLHDVFTHYIEDNDPIKKISLQYKAYKEELNELLNNHSDFQLELLYSDISNKTGFPIELLINTFKLMYNALPKPNEDGTVSKALRTLQKDPAITYSYSAGKKSISEALSQELLLTFVNTFIDIQNKGGLDNYLKGIKENQKEEVKAIYNTMEYISSLYKKNIKALEHDIKNKSLSEIWLKVGNKNIILSNFFNKVLAPTYGEAVYNALEKNFKSYREYNNNMNQMFAIMYQLFTTVYNKKMEILAEKYPLGIPLKEEQKIVKELSSLYPSLRLIYSDSLSEGILLLNTEKSRSKDNKVSNPIIKNNELVQETTSTNIRTFSNAGSSGSVIPIHYIDGTGMVLSLNDNPNIIPIHDAEVISALDAIKRARKYNEDMYLVSKEYNLYEELYNRTIQVIEEYNKLIKDYPDLDTTSKIIVRDSRNRKNDKDKTIDEIMKEISKSVIENNRHRDSFYSQNHFIANMGGPSGSGVEINPFSSLPENRFKEAIDGYGDYSSPYGYQTDGEIRETLQNAVDNVEARIKLFDNLQDLAKEYGNKIEDEKHIEHLKSVLRKIDPKYLKDLVIQISTNREVNAGMLEDNSVVIGFDGSKKDLDESTRNAPYGQSLSEIYAHELIHAGTRFALANKDSLNLNDIVNKILEIQKKSGDVITWEDLMPDNYDLKLQSVYEQYAKDIIEYIFNNPKGNLKGVAEFIAYGLTNEKVINKLKNIPLIEKKDYSNITLFNRLVELAKTILDIAFGKIKFSEGFSEFTNIMLGNKSIRYRNNLYSELELLTTKLSYANRKAANKLMQHPMKLVEQMFKTVADLTRKGNNFLSPKLRYLTNMLDIQGKTVLWKTELTDNWLTDTKKLINVLAGFAFSQTRRNAFASWLSDVAGISQQGTLLSIYRDISSIDNQTNRLDNIITLTRLVEQSSKGIESTAYTNLIKGFDRPLTNEENIAITKACLFTDLQSLLNDDDSNIEEIKSLLNNKENINKKIEEINKKLMHNENYLWYRNQAFGLARFMVTGVGNEIQNFNAKNIAEGKLLGKDIKASDYTIKLIDQLATLYALSFNQDNDNKLTANLTSKGLLNLLKVHKQFVKESTEGIKTIDKDGNIQTTNTVSDIHTIKGYTKQILDPSFDITVDLISNKEELAKSGYKLIRKLNENEITKNSGLAIYRRTFANTAHRDGSGFIISGANAIGTTLKDSAYRLYRNIDPENKVAPIRTWEIYTKNAEIINKKLKKVMLTKKLTMEDFNNISQGYSPIINPDTGIVSDYRITMSNEHKISDLNMELDGLTILSKMYASQNTKLNASGRNKILVEFLKDDMKTNMNPISKRDLDNNKYILVTEDTNNKFLKEAWKVLPKELLEAAREEDFYIREDWLQRLFGTPNISLNDIAIIHNKANRYIKRFISIAEYVVKIIASLAKTNILLKIPGVLIGNIASNFYYSVMTGSNPIKVFRKTIENYKATKDYIETKKALNAIIFKKRIGTATKRELQLKNWYKSKLENNIVHPLMEKGMYQAIIEDSNVTDIENISRLHKAINNNKIINKLPKSIKQIGKQLYITEGTFIYDFMWQLTQFSDFASRATEYQLQMEKAPEKYTIIKKDGKTIRRLNDNWIKYEEKVTKDVWEAFINYDIPQSSLMQYLNDMGILMFTKYAFRIQRVIAKNILNNPIGVLMFMLGQSYIMNTEDIMEQNIFNKHWSALLHNPLENFIDVAIPMPLQYYYGMRNTGI